ncbi:uncharacterized protein BO87DRAFT_459220 [Aspergillus neoniger CBS 115656]|uniref:Uncharacterized protein n=1 Tax=Aspergillus neoniger (strain CBS 115656) TaxID=1448310 RepID=A0A318YJ99_ASPNB|nr:hypothetical protein BO87DRAFT_459220 [Aspergillus neoniger CBS 115656]PYH34379.1 hypothetical protein BO87DRAFT_459220 [Aspergillus neoniger CBS 115656]
MANIFLGFLRRKTAQAQIFMGASLTNIAPRLQWMSGHIREKIDNTLPAAHTQKLYGSLPGGRAYWLSTYAKTFGFREDDYVDSEMTLHIGLVHR